MREIIGSGKAFGIQILPSAYEPVTIFILAPGAFFVLAGLCALQNKVKITRLKKEKETVKAGCGEGCASCGNSSCGGKVFQQEMKNREST